MAAGSGPVSELCQPGARVNFKGRRGGNQDSPDASLPELSFRTRRL